MSVEEIVATPRKKGQRGTLPDELASALTHGVGLAAAVTAVVWTLAGHEFAGHWMTAAFCVYGGSLIFTYLCSTLYHSLAFTRAKPVFRVLDHSAIYVLIAGTYTAIVPAVTSGAKAWGMLLVIWVCAVTGTTLGAVFHKRQSRAAHGVKVATYIGMGWVAVLLFPDFIGLHDPAVFWLIVGGGLCYTAGTAFYGWKTLPFSHAYWHLAVLAGSALQFAAILQLV